MSSLTRFKQRLGGEPQVVNVEPDLGDWVKIVTETQEQQKDAHDTEIAIINEEPAAEAATEIVLEFDPETMTKAELDDYAQEHGVQLDRRQSKKSMITEFIQKLKEKN